MGGRGGARGGGGGGGGGKRPEEGGTPRQQREAVLRNRADHAVMRWNNVHDRLKEVKPDTPVYRNLLKQRRGILREYDRLSNNLRIATGSGLSPLPTR